MKKMIVTTLAISALATVMQGTYANNKDKSTQQKVAVNAPIQNKKTWLGVSLAPVPKALSKQLGNLIPENQGVMVQSVTPNSPASKAGIKAYDILLRLNDQKLYSAQQLAGLIASSKADSEITLNLVREGKSQDIKVNLEAREVAVYPQQPMSRHPFFGFNNGFGNNFNSNDPFFAQPFFQPGFPRIPQIGGTIPLKPSGKVNVMQQFESLSIKQTGDGKVHAEVSFDNNGDKKEFSFDGTYDEVRKQIKETKELPEDKKNSLLNSLENNPKQFIPDYFWNSPSFPIVPFFNPGSRSTPSWFGTDKQY